MMPGARFPAWQGRLADATAQCRGGDASDFVCAEVRSCCFVRIFKRYMMKVKSAAWLIISAITVRTKPILMLLSLSISTMLFGETEYSGGYNWNYTLIYPHGVSDYAAMSMIAWPRAGSCAATPKPSGDIVIPYMLGGKLVFSIGTGAFYNCSDLTSVTMDDSVEVIGPSAFSGCCELSSITFSKKLTTIEASAFSKCSSLASVKLPDGLTYIGSGAFLGCSSLESVFVPDSVTNVSASAFCQCVGLKGVSLPVALEGVLDESSVFSECAKDLIVTYRRPSGIVEWNIVDGELKTVTLNGATDIVIPSNVVSIGVRAVTNCANLVSVTIPNSVTNISYGAFEWCYGLRDLTIPGSVAAIGDYAFYGCGGMTNLVICEGVKAIGARAFDRCVNLVAVSLADSVVEFGLDCFGSEHLGGATHLGSYKSPAYYKGLYRAIFGNRSAIEISAKPDVDVRYALSLEPADRTISSVVINGDAQIADFPLVDGKVYDCAIRIVNTSAQDVKVTLPAGFEYEAFEGTDPLTIPANSCNILTLTQTSAATFLVSREKLKSVQ